MFNIVPLPRLSIATPRDLRAADSRACAQMAPRRGVPRTAREWTALVKIASGEHDIAPVQHARLVALGLIDGTSSTSELTRHGRLTLGLTD